MPLVFPVPPLAPLTAHALAIAFASTYIASIYLSKHTRLSFRAPPAAAAGQDTRPKVRQQDERWRDDPDVIKARLLAVGIATLACFVAVAVVLAGLVPAHIPNVQTTRVRLGLTTAGLRPTHFLLTPLLFLGPLTARLLSSSPTGLASDLLGLFREAFRTWVGARNLLFAPLTEEAVFRACVLAVYQLAGLGRGVSVGVSPLAFGLAHVHHAWEVWNRYGRTPTAAKRAVIASTMQLSYTTLFGAYTALLFLRTGSLLPPLAAHAWCNALGLPSLGGDLASVSSDVSYPYPAPESPFARGVPAAPPKRSRMVQLKRAAVLTAYALGVIGFGAGLRGWGDAWLGLRAGQGAALTQGAGESLYWARFVSRREGTVVFY
ncbi:Abi-domain-containing protein [Athelia psychrophila]|uniref:intramembrane prenyl-peptidase Rce1 n=1 Tax=Athelia psychrophila TaxID=1759441 RepID=A0A165XRM1_9AGAM|nr:Abi-domain-containing protein [Fibularhizoctonia sp. CBS 109695]